MGDLKKWSFSSFLLILLLAATFFSLSFTLFCRMDAWMDSDNASDAFLAREMLHEHSLLPATWFYSSEIKVLSAPLLIAPVLQWTHDLMLSRSLASILLVLFLCFVWAAYLRSLRQTWFAIGLTLLLLLSPLSSPAVLDSFFITANYDPFIICILLVLMAVNRLADAKKTLLNSLTLGLVLLLSYLLGLSGPRFLACLFLPLLMTELLLNLFRQKHLFSKNIVLSLALVLLCGLGYLHTRSLAASGVLHYSDYSSIRMAGWADLPLRLLRACSAMLVLAGGLRPVPLASLAGLATLYQALFFFFLCFAAVSAVFRWKTRSERQKRLVLFFWTAAAINFGYIVLSAIRISERYHLLTLVFMFLLLPLLLDTAPQRPFPKAVLFLLIILEVLAVQYQVMVRESYLKPAQVDQRRVVDYLEKNGYTFGYATYWHAGLLSLLSNGQVEIAHIHGALFSAPALWLTPSRYYDRNYHPGRTFLLLTSDEAARAPETLLWGSVKQAEVAGYVIYGWENNPFDFLLFFPWEHRDLDLAHLPRQGGKTNKDGSLLLQPGERVYGPFWTLSPGKYLLKLGFKAGQKIKARVLVCSGEDLITQAVVSRDTAIPFSLAQSTPSLDFPVYNPGPGPLTVRAMSLEAVK